MKFNVKGKYRFIQNGKVIYKGENLITLLGESFFLNRLINNEFEPITHISLGTGNIRPKKSDIELGNKTVEKRVNTSVDLNTKSVILKATFTAREILNTTEIGASNGNILISHDLFEKIGNDFLDNSTSDVDVEYMFELSTSSSRTDFEKATGYNNVYYVAEPSLVVGVLEKSTKSGYICVNSIAAVESTAGAYYYNISNNNLYVHTTTGNNPNIEELSIQTR